MDYKTSRYNIYFSHNDKEYIYNTLSTSIVEVENELSINLQNNTLSNVNINYFEELIKQGFIVHADSDEVQKYLSFYDDEKQIAQNTSLGITIIPTYSCNLKCTYCLQGQEHKSIMMSQESINAILLYIEDYVKTHQQLKHISISFYGGEPLLHLEACTKITNGVSEIGKRNNIETHFMIITNLTLLSAESIDFIKNYNVFLQVSIDGSKEQHDLKRIFPDKRGTYDLIISNLKRLTNAGLKKNVTIRLNVDLLNLANIDSMLANVRGYSDDLYFSLLQEFKGMNDGICEDVIPSGQTSIANFEFGKTYKKYNLPAIRNFGKKSPCAISSSNRIWIDCNNDIYKCEILVNNPEFAVGKILDNGIVEYNKNYTKYTNWHPVHNQRCIACELLPLCAGGCPARFASETNNPLQYCNCSQSKETLVGHLKNYLDLEVL